MVGPRISVVIRVLFVVVIFMLLAFELTLCMS